MPIATEKLYGFEAELKDGTILTSFQMENAGRGGYEALPHDQIAIFRITMLVFPVQENSPVALGEPRKFYILTIHLARNERVIWRTRHQMTVGGAKRDVIVVGARRNIKGHSVVRMTYIFQDTGEIHQTGGWIKDEDLPPSNVRSWFSEVGYRAYEHP